MPRVSRKSSGFGKRMTEAERQVTAALFAAGGIIEDAAKGLIMQGSVSGKRHVASRPGEPPNNDTQVLHHSIETAVVKPLVVEVSANAPYAAPLERGSSKMAARPFMGPAGHIKRDEARALVIGAMKKIARGGKVTT